MPKADPFCHWERGTFWLPLSKKDKALYDIFNKTKHTHTHTKKKERRPMHRKVMYSFE